ncbi:hypothetical protein MGALJ_60080 (plasmid) [Mycobacterium gallinarum]|uniref:Uncharacterized protein n=1 Tax=Mycobacterium gallinarum TaxID=39689 RepID=A0A9W4FIJ9_9MYCO|nr:hypothetical protein MGALJ_60080 [Mycobacterium gallinarum]
MCPKASPRLLTRQGTGTGVVVTGETGAASLADGAAGGTVAGDRGVPALPAGTVVGTAGATAGAGGPVGTGVPAAVPGVVAGVGATPGVVPSAGGNGVPALPGSGVPKLVVGKGLSGLLAGAGAMGVSPSGDSAASAGAMSCERPGFKTGPGR